ncbi:HAMP domain-containing histidine kinase [Cryobacterium glaciale]|uniref:histidine kinase n=1 Tax=Cryobacterium glaciale TaxID=1259145 RepID=A0A4R8UW32_9MICO|nr:HAMP domain-containing sensor histidine kinase [Cryobacterium glaciale]TFB73223.1 HAMP domain-containing histidine kinase [Cryobacterium glaciale]
MRTTSLRVRVVAAVLAMLTIVLVTVGILVNLVLGEQLRADLQQRLIDRAGYAQILAEEGLEAQSLANRLTGDGVTVTYSVGGDTVYGRADPTPGGDPDGGRVGDRGPGAPPHAETVPGAVVSQSGDRVSVTQTAAEAQAAETTARDAAQVAAAAEERMRQLLADVSRELRTPVAGLQASAETLLRDNPPRAERESLTVGMIQQTQRAARLVDDLLLITRLDQGDPGAAFAPVDLSALTRGVVAEQRLLGASREFEVTVAPDVWVSGDAQRLAQIVTNLLGNARNATEVGASIRTSLVVVNGAAQLEVTDSGGGVPEVDRERIFERFVRLDPSRASNRGGSGLGLSIARALARTHGGTLECRDPVSPVGGAVAAEPRGARFALTLPLAPA